VRHINNSRFTYLLTYFTTSNAFKLLRLCWTPPRTGKKSATNRSEWRLRSTAWKWM